MKFCDECGAKLEDAAEFCEECGTKVERVNAPKNKKAIVVIMIVCILVLIIVVVLILHTQNSNNKNCIVLDDNVTTEEPTTEESTTEESTTEEPTTEEPTTEEPTTEESTTEETTTEEPTTEVNKEYLALIENIDAEYLDYDSYIGKWHDEFSGRCFIEITSENNMLHIFMRWGNDYKSSTIWEMNCYYDENSGCIAYISGRQIVRTYLDAEDYYDNELYSDGSGVFYYKDGALKWLDKKENKGNDCFFIKY